MDDLDPTGPTTRELILRLEGLRVRSIRLTARLDQTLAESRGVLARIEAARAAAGGKPPGPAGTPGESPGRV
jgi:hypothetical protein